MVGKNLACEKCNYRQVKEQLCHRLSRASSSSRSAQVAVEKSAAPVLELVKQPILE